MSKYLYGLKIQGIQSYIFQTNKLTEIIGGSELVEFSCSKFFEDLLGNNMKPNQFLMNAAGNVKYIFDSKEECSFIYQQLPKKLAGLAPGLNFIQAVVEYNGILSIATIHQLEAKLSILKNNSSSYFLQDFMIFQKSRRTGFPAMPDSTYAKKGEFIDHIQHSKRKAADRSSTNSLLTKLDLPLGKGVKSFPFEMDEIVKDNSKSYLAVIHVDGNGLGQLIQQFTSQMKDTDITLAFQKFSYLLDKSMKVAVQSAFKEVVLPASKNKQFFPFRPVILGGDDFTAIMEASLALDFTKILLNEFENQTRLNYSSFAADYNLGVLFLKGLTACAGIAYVKASYPFHYAVDLSEMLCKEAKKVSKSLIPENTLEPAPSSLLFHRVQSSFIEDDYDDIVTRELLAPENVHFNYGPYFIHHQKTFSTIDELQRKVSYWSKDASPLSSIRNWLTELMFSPASAKQLQSRIFQVHNARELEEMGFKRNFDLRENGEHYTPLYDVVSICSII